MTDNSRFDCETCGDLRSVPATLPCPACARVTGEQALALAGWIEGNVWQDSTVDVADLLRVLRRSSRLRSMPAPAECAYVHGDLRPGFTFRELEGAMDAVAEGARREFLRGVGTTELRNALGKADDWGEVGLADLFAGELQRRGAGR